MQKQKDIDLVLNPNTSIEMLLELGLEYPNELLQNPVFPFLFLEDPAILDKMSHKLKVKLLETGECPHWFIKILLNQVKGISNGDYISLILDLYQTEWESERLANPCLFEIKHFNFYWINNIERHILANCNLSNLYFNYSHIHYILFANVNFANTTFVYSEIRACIFINCSFENTLFHNMIDIFNCEFIHCQLHNNEHLKYLKDRGHFLSFRYCRWE